MIALVLGTYAIQAQTVVPAYALSTFSKTSDTCANSETLYMTLPSVPYDYDLSINPYVTNVSGTLTGACYLQASNGTSWVTQNVGNNNEMIAVSDTLSLTTGGNTSATIWYLKSKAYKYRVAFACTGTAVDKIFVLYMLKTPR